MKSADILLIDDDPLFLFLTEKKLKDLPYLNSINCIDHVKEAREYLDNCSTKKNAFPDVIFLDINMPGIGGMDFADLYSRRYTDKFPDTKLVILTSSNSRKDKSHALEIPAVKEFVQKPLTEDKLRAVLEK